MELENNSKFMTTKLDKNSNFNSSKIIKFDK